MEISMRNKPVCIPPYLSTRVWGRLSAARRDDHLQYVLSIPPLIKQLRLVDTRSSVPGRRWRRSRLIRILELIIHKLERITLSPTPTSPRLGVRALADPLFQSLDPTFVAIQDGVPRGRTFLQVLKELRHAIAYVRVLLAKQRASRSRQVGDLNPDLLLVESEGGLDFPQLPLQAISLKERLASTGRANPITLTRSLSVLLISHSRSAIATLCIIALLVGRLFWKASLS